MPKWAFQTCFWDNFRAFRVLLLVYPLLRVLLVLILLILVICCHFSASQCVLQNHARYRNLQISRKEEQVISCVPVTSIKVYIHHCVAYHVMDIGN